MNTTKHYKHDAINKTTVMAAPLSPLTLMESKVQNNQTYHHNMAYPSDKKDDKAAFEIEFPVMLTSSMNEVVGDHGERTHHIFADVFGNYGIAYQTVTAGIDKMLANVMPNTSAAQYRDLFFLEMEKLGLPLEPLKEQFKNEIEATGKDFNDEYFRYMAIGAMIWRELAKDEDGMSIYNAMANLKEAYCVSLDKQPAVKQKIYGGIGIPDKKLSKPSASMVKDVVQWQKLSGDHPTMAKKNDYTKSPQIHFKLFGSTLKPDAKMRNDVIVIPGTRQVIWAKIYDYINDPFTNKAITSYEEMQHLIYRKGDSMSGNGGPFKLLASIETVTPSIFWSELTKEGQVQLKISKFKPSRKVPLSGGSRTLTADEGDNDRRAHQQAASKFNLAQYGEQDDGQRQEPQGSPVNKRSFDQADDQYDDLDAMIAQDEQIQQDAKRSRSRY